MMKSAPYETKIQSQRVADQQARAAPQPRLNPNEPQDTSQPEPCVSRLERQRLLHLNV